MATAEPRLPVHFDQAAWEEDLARATAHGRAVASQARQGYEKNGGVLVSELHACRAEHQSGIDLPQCVKAYLPAPAGNFGIVLHIVKRGAPGRLQLEFQAFGVRHHPPESHAPTVYEIAYRRLSG